MITFAQKPGIFSYWVTHHDYTKLGNRVVSENKEVFGYGRFQPADLLGIWDLPFIKIFKDGNQWCALVGGDLQEGIAEFTPITERNEFDQITDFGHEYVRTHSETRWKDRFVYWLPHEINLMSEQAKSRSANAETHRTESAGSTPRAVFSAPTPPVESN